MKSCRHILAFFSCMILAAIPLSEQSNAGREYAATVDSEGIPWKATVESGELVLSRWQDNSWKPEIRQSLSRSISGLKLAPDSSGLIVGWLGDERSDSALTLSTVRGRTITRIKPAALAGLDGIQDYELASLPAGEVGVLLLEREHTHWLQFETTATATSADCVLDVKGFPSSPSLLPGKDIWLAWQEKGGGRIMVAFAPVAGGKAGAVTRFPVRGFGGTASPALVEAGGPAIVWQGNDEGKATLFYRKIGASGPGIVARLPVPGEFQGTLISGRASGSGSVIAAYGWNWRRWSGVIYDLGKGPGKAEPQIRGTADSQLLRPSLAISASGEEHWFWLEGPDESPSLRTARASELSSEVLPKPAVRQEEDELEKLLAFGDSITAGTVGGVGDTPGYTDDLELLFSEKVKPAVVIQRGDPGEKTPEGLIRLSAELELYPDVDYVLILEGTNDYYFGPRPTPEESAENVGLMADMARATGAIPLIGTMLPRAGSDPGAVKNARLVSEAIVPMARLRGVTLGLFQEQFPLKAEYYSDAGKLLHPNQEGYAIMASIWMEALLTFQGDVNRDAVVDELDAQLMSVTLNSRKPNLRFNPDCDFNDDGMIDMLDLAFLINQMGKSFENAETGENPR